MICCGVWLRSPLLGSSSLEAEKKKRASDADTRIDGQTAQIPMRKVLHKRTGESNHRGVDRQENTKNAERTRLLLGVNLGNLKTKKPPTDPARHSRDDRWAFLCNFLKGKSDSLLTPADNLRPCPAYGLKGLLVTRGKHGQSGNFRVLNQRLGFAQEHGELNPISGSEFV